MRTCLSLNIFLIHFSVIIKKKKLLLILKTNYLMNIDSSVYIYEKKIRTRLKCIFLNCWFLPKSFSKRLYEKIIKLCFMISGRRKWMCYRLCFKKKRCKISRYRIEFWYWRFYQSSSTQVYSFNINGFKLIFKTTVTISINSLILYSFKKLVH